MCQRPGKRKSPDIAASNKKAHTRCVRLLVALVSLRYVGRKDLERATRIELATPWLGTRCSTTELHPLMKQKNDKILC